jgi:enoyl-CoA hydratase
MTGTKVSLTLEAGTAWITLDGPERRNALDAQAARDLAAICDTIDADPAAGVAVITGTGRAFCSGADTAILNRIRAASAAPHGPRPGRVGPSRGDRTSPSDVVTRT